MVLSKSVELATMIAKIVRAPARFVGGDWSGGITLAQLLESLTSLDEWAWLSRDAVVEVVTGNAAFSFDGPYVRSVEHLEQMEVSDDKEKIPVADSLYFADPDTLIDGYQQDGSIDVYPSELWLRHLVRRRRFAMTDEIIVFRTVAAALKVSWALSGKLELAGVAELRGHVSGTLFGASQASNTAVLVDDVDVNELIPLSLDALEVYFKSLWKDVWLNEVLFLDDLSAQSLAAKKLFKTGTQASVEAALIGFLGHADTSVRVNVLNALGAPAYSVGFAPGASLPSRAERLEHVVLTSSTVRALLRMLPTETDQDVLDGLVCTLSAQFFGLSLQPLAREVDAALKEVLPRLQSEQTVRDARKIIRELRLLR